MLVLLPKKKPGYNTKFSDLEIKLTDYKHDKYITTTEFNKLTVENFAARLAEANLITKTDFDKKLTSLNKNITSNKPKYLVIENELKKLKTFDFGYFTGKSYFDEDSAQNYYIFQPISKYLTTTYTNKNLTNKKVSNCSGDCDYENIHSVNPLYLIFHSATGYFEEKNSDKYLIINSNKRYEDVLSKIKWEIKIINGEKALFYEKYYARIGGNTDDDVPLNKQLTFSSLIIVIKYVFQKGEELDPLIYLDECLYESVNK